MTSWDRRAKSRHKTLGSCRKKSLKNYLGQILLFFFIRDKKEGWRIRIRTSTGFLFMARHDSGESENWAAFTAKSRLNSFENLSWRLLLLSRLRPSYSSWRRWLLLDAELFISPDFHRNLHPPAFFHFVHKSWIQDLVSSTKKQNLLVFVLRRILRGFSFVLILCLQFSARKKSAGFLKNKNM